MDTRPVPGTFETPAPPEGPKGASTDVQSRITALKQLLTIVERLPHYRSEWPGSQWPKFGTCASPQSCTCNWHKAGDPVRRLLLDQLDRIGAVERGSDSASRALLR